MYFNFEIFYNIKFEDFTIFTKCLSRVPVRFAVNIHKSDHIVIETVIFIYTLEPLRF